MRKIDLMTCAFPLILTSLKISFSLIKKCGYTFRYIGSTRSDKFRAKLTEKRQEDSLLSKFKDAIKHGRHWLENIVSYVL